MSDNINTQLIELTSSIPIKSFTSDDTYYINISFDINKKSLEFNCTCGLKYNIKNRNNCKHVIDIKKYLCELSKSNEETVNNISLNLFKINI
jgi:hypothetical protein